MYRNLSDKEVNKVLAFHIEQGERLKRYLQMSIKSNNLKSAEDFKKSIARNQMIINQLKAN